MKSTEDIIKHLDINDDYIIDQIVSMLKIRKFDTIYISQDLITKIEFPVIKLYFVEYSERYIFSLREKLLKLGYKCSSVKESTGVSPLKLATGVYFTISNKTSLFQKIKNILNKILLFIHIR